eukprot:228464-Pleurochrysis_carterae.AAC.1
MEKQLKEQSEKNSAEVESLEAELDRQKKITDVIEQIGEDGIDELFEMNQKLDQRLKDANGRITELQEQL